MVEEEQEARGWVTLRAFVLGVLLSGVFAWITALQDNANPGARPNLYLAANWVAVLPHVALLLVGLLINPLLRRIRFIRLFSKEELLLVFVMCAVSSGIASFGLSGQLVPTVSALSNKAWNTDQSQWDVSVTPLLNENYFIAGKGTQAAAVRLRDVHLRYEEARTTHQMARDLVLGRARLAELEAERREIAAIADPVVRVAREGALDWPMSQARQLVEQTSGKWAKLGVELDPGTVVESFPGKIEALKAERDRLRLELKRLNQGAFDAVANVRKGLPETQRALPGFFYARGEGGFSYRARVNRLRNGVQSLRMLEQAEAVLSRCVESGEKMPADWPARIQAAATALEPSANLPALTALDNQLGAQLKELEARLAERGNEARMLRNLRRNTDSSRLALITEQIDHADKVMLDLEKRATRLRDRDEKEIKPVREMCARVRRAQESLVQVAAEAGQASPETYPEILARTRAVMAAYRSFDASTPRFWLGDVPWSLWLRPLFNWLGLVFLGYLVLMAFNTLIFRQWAHHEKLIYPLAEVTLLIVGGARGEGKEKPLFRSGLFWLGLLLAAGILGWNNLALKNIIPNISPIGLDFLWNKYVGGSVFGGLGSTYFCVIFMVIGITFLVPASISFSLWFFELLYMGLLLVLVWLGYGSDRWSLGGAPGRFGLGSGAMLVFGVAILWTCRNYLMCVFKPAVLKGLAEDEARELRVASGVFLGSSLALMLLLTFGLHVNFFLVAVFFLLMLIMVVALVRAVAEGGVIGMEGVTSPLGILGAFFGMIHTSFAPIMIAPVSIFSSFIFGGTKAFIAPMMANALKIREHFRMPRLQFHGALWAGILIATGVSVVTLILLSYDRGADNLHGWLNSGWAQGMLGGVKTLSEPVFPPLTGANRNWLVAGMILMGGLLFFRRRVFGIPHPIGLLMLMNTSMYGLWGSILIGWLCKSLVSKYTSHEHYIAIRRFFIGLIMGHLLSILMGWSNLEFHWG
jgi:hypothetical protein